MAERKVEGEAAIVSMKYHRFEESRESAGEPDGKADEELVAEPPALPKSPPPLESYSSHNKRSSFLHGGELVGPTTTTTTKPAPPRPTVPQKPVALKPAGASSLASLLSESRAYEFRLSQMRNSQLVHSQSESQLCAVDEPAKRVSGGDEVGRMSAESCSQLNRSEMFKGACAKSVEKEEQVCAVDGRLSVPNEVVNWIIA